MIAWRPKISTFGLVSAPEDTERSPDRVGRKITVMIGQIIRIEGLIPLLLILLITMGLVISVCADADVCE